MAWGIFKKIQDGARKSYDFVKGSVLPTVNKVVEIAKPLLEGTKYGKYVEKVNDISKKVDNYTTKFGDIAGYKSAKTMKPRFNVDVDDEDELDDEE